MKKFRILALIMAFATALCCFAGCNNGGKTTSSSSSEATDDSEETTVLSVSAPDGAPIMAIAEMIKNDKNYTYDIISSDGVASTLTAGESDFVIAPTNAGMNIAIKKGNYKICAVTSWGNLYLVAKSGQTFDETEKNLKTFMSQFSSKTVAFTAVNAVPDKTFKHLLNKAKITDCECEASEASVIMAGLKKGEIEYAVLGEPAVTTAMKNISGLKILCSLSEVWSETENMDYPQASIFAKATLSSSQIEKFLDRVKTSIEYLNASEANAFEVGSYMEQTGESTLKGAIVKEAYLRMNQKFVKASECKEDIIKFITMLGVSYTEENASVFYEKV